MLSIQTNVNSLVAQQNLNVNNAFQAKTIEQLTSGYRINSSGDDAAGLAVANKYRSSVAELTQGVSNANDGIGQLQIIDGGLTNISQMLDRLKTLATQSASSTFAGSRTTVNNEYQSLLSEINRQAANIGLSTAAGGGTNLSKMDVYIGGGDAANSVNSNAQVSVDLSKSAVDTAGLGLNNTSVLGGGVEFASNTAKSLSDPGSFFSVGQNFTVNYIDSDGAAQSQTVTYNASASETGANVVSDLNNALNKASGVTAQIGSDGQLQFVGNGNFTVSTTGAAGAAVDNVAHTAMSLVNTSNYNLTTNTPFVNYADNADNAPTDVLTFTDAAANVTKTFTLDSATAPTLGTAVNNMNTMFKADGMSITALAVNGEISFQSAGQFSISLANTVASGGTGTGAIFSAVGAQAAATQNTQASTTGAALNAIDQITAANTLLGLVQGHVGAGENTLNYASNLAQSQITNFDSAQSQIRDTDVAAAAANLSKAQVLQQASIAAMAQANSAPQQVLSLLRG